jgi:hypothetical protein
VSSAVAGGRPPKADGGSAMKVTSWQGLALATVALGLLAGCTGGGAETPRSAPGSSAPTPPAHSAPPSTPSAEPTHDGSMPPTSRVTSPPLTLPKPVVRKPVIGKVWTTPRLECQTVCTLTPPAGTITLHAQISYATRVQFFLVPTGTGTWGSRESIGVDRSGKDGWSVRYTYADEPLWSHLVVVASGPGGTSEKLPFNLYHPDPR